MKEAVNLETFAGGVAVVPLGVFPPAPLVDLRKEYKERHGLIYKDDLDDDGAARLRALEKARRKEEKRIRKLKRALKGIVAWDEETFAMLEEIDPKKASRMRLRQERRVAADERVGNMIQKRAEKRAKEKEFELKREARKEEQRSHVEGATKSRATMLQEEARAAMAEAARRDAEYKREQGRGFFSKMLGGGKRPGSAGASGAESGASSGASSGDETSGDERPKSAGETR